MKWPDIVDLRGIRGQITLLMLVSIVATHLIITATFLLNRPDQPDPWMVRGPAQLIAIVQLLGAAPPADRPRLIADIARAFPDFGIAMVAAGQPPAGFDAARESPSHGIGELRRHLSDDYRIFVPGSGGPNETIAIRLPDGAMISTRAPPDRGHGPFWGGPWMTTLIIVVISLILLGLWAARALTAPLSSFAEAAENFSLDGASAPLPKRGPQEIRALARALNRMRERITVLIDDRTKMLAAISHDLRTPITRLRLRAEFIEDENHRAQMLRDLDQMASMLTAVLSFLRNGRRLEPMTLIDLATTLHLVTDQFADVGCQVSYDGPDHAMVTARPDDLYRAVTNLVENAVRFGTSATIRLRVASPAVTIEVEDDGPGIADARKDDVLQPFVRGDDARNMDEASGFGLGLSIARAIVLAHGGELSLNDRQPHGLIARIALRNAAG
ncbi:MAG: HAMP domain-containing protein [Rhodopseudomonas sp.]|uniref:ATP-binding protein n=1 Tax=Rhodopseudomonas sp. TaxID=1078 RepID=UPI0017F3EEDC|nr:ATP-binding protein [Rhodopseudomonas sp.]NVN87518.1 HAMP domain-containing protein [Rhodopseudomonas sp.]